jgi:hypothetical protein
VSRIKSDVLPISRPSTEAPNLALVLPTASTIVSCSAALMSFPETIYLVLVSLTVVVLMVLALVLVI